MGKKGLAGFILPIMSVCFVIGLETDLHAMTLGGPGIAAVNLRCEYRTDPLGIDVVQPRLSWVVDSSRRGQRQTAYQVIVASSEKKLSTKKADLWDSGKVQSNETACIVYAGKSLVSNQECFWKVRIWDKDGKISDWSKSAYWTMGLLDSADWRGQWIGYDVNLPSQTLPEEFQKAKWIWSSAMKSGNAPPGKMYFRTVIELPDTEDIKKAFCYVGADDSFTLYVNGEFIVSHGNLGKIRMAELKGSLHAGRNVLAVAAQNNGNTENPAGLIAMLVIELQNGRKEIFYSGSQWRLSTEAKEAWMMPDYDDTNWNNAEVIEDLWKQAEVVAAVLPPARYLRHEFAVSKSVKRACLYATALGIYKLHLNGQQIGLDYFSPGWTDYKKRVYYRTYDVTTLLKKGDNAIGAILADGWYAGYVGYGFQRNHYGKDVRLLAQMFIEYNDGSTALVATGPDWKGSCGPIQEADFLMGEVYDATQEMTGWDKVRYNDSAWSVVVTGKELEPRVQAAVSEPVVEFEEIRPASFFKSSEGHYIFDMGQNFAGVVRLMVHGEVGQKIRLRYSERLNPDGTLYTENLRKARATDIYVCKGTGKEIWQPRFTFHGFQYVEISGIDYKPELSTITGIALSSNTPRTGAFECSDPMINKLSSNIYWTQRMNFIDIPTDCPQRDERLGWTGDAQVYIRTATLNTDVQAFFTKWLQDLVDTQREDGQFPKVSPPHKTTDGDGGPAWADAGVICPWTIYQVYGDKRLLERDYPAMKKYVEFCKNRSTAELLPPEKFHCFGDWLNIDDNTPNEVIYTAYFALSTKITAEAAVVLGKTDDARELNTLFEAVKQAFNCAYVTDDGRIKGDSQTAYILAISFDLVDGVKYKAAADRLVELIEKRDWHLSTGFIGTKDLMLVLSKIGRNDVAYRLLHNDTFPSWGFSIRHGATSIWERWNGWTPDKGFDDPTMNSFAHYSFGAVYQWMVENIGGIRAGDVGYKTIVIKPQPGDKLNWAKTSYCSIRGLIRTEWKRKDAKFTLDITVPANTNAKVYIPTASVEMVKEQGKSIHKARGVKFLRMENDMAVVEVESGIYHFISRLTD